jgi:hypothetical protein
MASSNAPHIFSHVALKSKLRGWLASIEGGSENPNGEPRIGHRIFLLLATNCVQIFVRFRSWITARPRLVRFAAPAIVFAVVLAPSIWMLSVIPPLWKDIDAYAQVTLPPGSGTILQYGPLYCFLARIPLYVGYAIDCVARGAPLPAPAFFIHPTLTDSGVFALLLSQHISLCFGTSI